MRGERVCSAVKPQHFLSHSPCLLSEAVFFLVWIEMQTPDKLYKGVPLGNAADEHPAANFLSAANWDFVMFSGNLNNSSPHPSMDCSANLSSPTGRCGLRFSSDSSYRSVMTDDSDQASVFGDLGSPSPFSAASTTDDSCFFSRDFPSQDSSSRFSLSSKSHHHQSLSRTSSSSLAGSSSSSLSPSWEETRISSLFGTLPRKSKRANVRKHIFKLIPGLQRSVEEEM